MRKLLIVSAVLAGGVLLTGCKKSLLVEAPPHFVSSSTLYKNYSGFEAGITGLYSLVRQEWNGLNGSTAMLGEMFMGGTDNMVTNHAVSGVNMIFQEWGAQNNAANTFYDDAFSWLYGIVSAANAIIIHGEGGTDINWEGGNASAEENKNRIIGEARAIRAWAYRHLSYNWGDVPLNLQESLGSTIRTDWERTPVATVRKQIIADLRAAEPYIPVEASLQGRMTKGAVQHYLSELYLVINMPDSALWWANKAINTPAYKLVTARYGVVAGKPGIPFMDMFHTGNVHREQGNTEALWVFPFKQQTVGGGQSLQRRHHTSRYANIRVGSVSPLKVTEERGGNGLGRMSLTKYAIDLYTPEDDRGSNFALRKYFILSNEAENKPAPADVLPPGYNYGDTIKLAWTNDITAASRSRTNWPFSRKADWADANNLADFNSYKDILYLRLGETYLLKAEAELRLGFPGDAANTINILRGRSHANDVLPADVTMDFILDERSRELIMEEQRRYTLLRTGTWLTRVKQYNKNGGQFVVARDTLFPIPQSVIDANLTRKMDQNPDY